MVAVPMDIKFFLGNSNYWYCYLAPIWYLYFQSYREDTMSDAGNKDGNKATASPPYIAYSTLKTVLKNFQEHGLPGRIDRSVLTNFSGSVGAQIIPALRFLHLIDVHNHPTEWLKGFVNTYGTDVWAEDLKHLLEEAYEPLAKLDLQTASPSQFDEAFSKAYPGAENVLRKCKSFYLAAAAEAKIAVSPYIMKNKKPRSGPTKKRAAKANGGKADAAQINPLRDPKHHEQETHKPLSEHVLTILDMKNLTDTEEKAVFTLLKFLRKEGK
jgi:hypothetical protein